ncbi:MAG: hypothetical protein QM530_01620 [Phycisphaerales bacterium]|nr:hypothetical protein [Phycisphaerales bacterium]
MMERIKRNIDEFFQEELGKLTEMPPSSVWDTLGKRLDNNKPKPRKIAWWLLALIATVLIGGSRAAYLAMNHNPAPSIQTNNFSTTNSTKHQLNTTIDTSSNTNLTQENQAAKKEIKPQSSGSKQLNRNNENKIASANTPTKKISEQLHEVAVPEESKHKHGSSMGNAIAHQDVAAAPPNNELLKKSLDDKNYQQKSDNNQLSNTPKIRGNSASTNENKAEQSANNRPLKSKKESLKEAISSAAPADKVVSNAKTQTASGISKTKDAVGTGTKKTDIVLSSAANTSMASPKDRLNSSSVNSPKNTAVTNDSASISKTITQKPSVRNAVMPDNAGRASKKTTNTNNNDNTTLAAQNDKKDRKDKASNQESALQKPLAKTSQNQPTSSQEEKPQNKTQIQANPTGGGVAAATQKPKQKKPINMLLGLKGGYERGWGNYTASKYVGNLFAEVAFSPKISFLFQPGIKIAQTNQEYTISSNGYYKINENGVNLYNVKKDSTGFPIAYGYAYTQSYDSIIAVQQAKRSYMEIELPFLFRFKFDQHFSILGGMNCTFGKILDFSSNLKTIAGLKLYDTIRNSKDSVAPSAPTRFYHTGSTPFSNYKEDTAAAISPIRFGYVFGISYQIQERLMLDLLVQQNLSRLNSVKDDGIRKLYTQPYVRFSVGYNIFGSKKK